MDIYSIELEYYIIGFAVVIGVILLLTTKTKPSISVLQQMVYDYETYIENCNDTINRINKTIERIQGKVFIVSGDETAAVNLVKKYNRLVDDILICHESIGYYIGKKNIKKYKRYKREADRMLVLIEGVLSSLERVEFNMQTAEEFEFNRARIEYEKSFQFEEERETPPKPIKRAAVSDVFFVGCNSLEEIERRYKSLAKVYHPDMPTGDKVTFQKILEEYERRKKKL